MNDFKDVTSTTFGLLLAYLLPGLTALYSLSFFSVRIDAWFVGVMSGTASAGLLVMMVFAGLILGVQLSVARSLLFEYVLCRDCGFKAASLSQIVQAGRFAAYRMLVDELYRYHQFWGAMIFVQPLLFYGWISTQTGNRVPTWLSVLVAVACEGATLFAAISSFRRYSAAKAEVLGENYAERSPRERKK